MHKRTQSAHGGKNNSILHHYNNNRKIIKITKREMERDKSLAKSEILEVPAQNIIEKRLLLTVPNKGKKPDIKPLPASSDLLNRLQDFMPKMKEANEALKVMEQNDTESDHGGEGQPYIELDLACGIFDLKDDEAVAAAERSLINQADVIEGGSSDPSTSDSSAEEEEEWPTERRTIPSNLDESNAYNAPVIDREATGSENKSRAKRHPGIQELS